MFFGTDKRMIYLQHFINAGFYGFVYLYKYCPGKETALVTPVHTGLCHSLVRHTYADPQLCFDKTHAKAHKRKMRK